MEWKRYTFVNGQDRTSNLNDVELAEIVMEIVMSNLHTSFQWNEDQTVLTAEG